jgi:hypothetical protein
MEIVEMLGAEIIADFCKDLSLEVSSEGDRQILRNIVRASELAISQKSELMFSYMKHQLKNPAFDDVIRGLGYDSAKCALHAHLIRKGGHLSRLPV